MSRLYAVWALAILGLYSFATWRGWDLFPAERGIIPGSVRSAPGGYRSYQYWRGGK